jgi:hypothetical protein
MHELVADAFQIDSAMGFELVLPGSDVPTEVTKVLDQQSQTSIDP